MNANTTQGGSSPDQHNEQDTIIAMAALILAAGAFVVSLAQALMQYLASSDARGKCTYEAIDMSAKSTKLGWNWTFWKLRVYYPVLNISFSTVMQAAVEQSNYHIDAPESPLSKLAKSKEGDRQSWGFTVLEETETDTSFLTVSDGYTTLVGDSDPVTSKELTWTETAQLVWWKLTHTAGPVNRPRASWAQMLMAFGIRDTSSMVYKHADADIIPGSVDAPIQRVKLFDLGMLALYLGFKKVTINARDRHLEAIGAFGTITTLKNNELGKVLHFEGDTLAIFAQISKGSINAYNDFTIGKFSFAPGISMNGIICPLHLLLQVSSQRWDRDRFRAKQRTYLGAVQSEEGLAKGQVAAEASLFEMLYRNPNLSSMGDSDGSGSERSSLVPQHVFFANPPEDTFRPKMVQKTTTGLSARHLSALLREDDDSINYHDLCQAIEHWSTATGLRLPTIIPASSLCLMTGCETGFPSSVLVEPIMPWLVALADQVKRSSETFTHVSGRMTTLFKTNCLMFVRSRDAFWYSFNYVGMEARLWQWGWILQETKEVYDCLDTEDQDDIILRDAEGEYTGDVQPVILTECYALLQRFNPREWAAKIEKIVTMQLLKFRPHNMIWTQILLIDVAIHFLVRGGFHDDEDTVGYNLWADEVVTVFSAIVHVWDPTAEEQAAAAAKDGSDRHSTRSTKPPIPPPPKATQDHVETLKEHETPMMEKFRFLEPMSKDEVEVKHESIEDTPPTEARPEFAQTAQTAPESPKPPKKPPISRTNSSPLDVDWDLAGSLRKQEKLFSGLYPERREAKVQKLASLLQLRALFVIALFLLMPDSSDVYLTDGERVEMPMV
ncbi:hypothetical protein C8A00DRAFT_37391 [Chaetomidium leptoderma]|uniref:Uncharacterized protein n=1 Tax=Chaetomidium leptoderma TaxID=669021 RepID=A0AAN6VET3_9PEZI|nr:hypothetical protein C8A00DRAFT_37391 [Chaetomidium leptoderma]